MIRRLAATLALLLACASAFAQEGETKAPQLSGGTAAPSIEPPFVASLLVIKADWTQSPAAKEIDADLRKAWGQDQASLKLLDNDAKAGPGLLFPTAAASIYTHEHYVSLLLWLDARQLVVHDEVFMAESGGGEWRQPVTVSLKKDGEFFGIQTPRPQNEPYFTRKREFTWSIRAMSMPQDPTWHFNRALVDYEKGRGQDQPQPLNPNTYDTCNFSIAPPEDGDAIIVHAFPAAGDDEFFSAANRKGILALIVIEKRPAPPKVAAEPKLLLPDKVWRLKPERHRGVHGGFGPISPLSTKVAPSTGSQARSLISKDVMISWSEGKDVAWGFSKSQGKWAEQKMDPPATDIPPVVGDSLAVWRVGSAYYAFSGNAGRWDVLRLPENHKPPPVIDDDFARVHDGDDVHTFAASTGRWSSPNASEAATESKPDEAQIKVFTLRHANASEAERLISQLFPRDIQSVAADPRTNSVIVRGTPENLEIIYAILTRLDQVESDSASSSTTAGKQEAPKAVPVAELTRQYQAKEQEAVGLARQIRELQSAPEAHKQPIEEVTASLRRAVADSFAARQQLHRAEATQLQQRVAGIQQDIQIRQKLSEQIIDHRVNDLLNPDLQWETGSRAASGTSATGSPAQGGSAGGTSAASNLPAAREYSDKLLERWQSVEGLYQGGKYGLEDLLRLASDLAEAESAAANGQGERRGAREKYISRLQAIKSVVDVKFKGGLEPEYHKLAVDAELLKAENLLASESTAKSALQSVPVNWQTSATDSILWEVLGVKVQAVTRQSVAQYGYNGGLLVEEVKPKAEILRVGDVILGLHNWETRSSQELCWILLQPLSKSVSVLNPRSRSTPETAEIRILRGEKVERMQVTLPPWSPVESSTSSTAAGRPRPDRSAAAASQSGTPPPSSFQLAATGEPPVIRSAADFRNQLQSLEDALRLTEQTGASKFGGQTAEQMALAKQQTVEARRRDLMFFREEYAAQLRLLELELQDAQLALESAAQQQGVARKRFDSGQETADSVLSHARAVQEAKHRSDRASTLLALYRKADPKDATSQPAAERDSALQKAAP